jgi:exodeoxyribonuclease V alpha subunit
VGTETVVEGVVERITFESVETSFRVLKVAVTGRPERLAVVGTFPPTALGARVRVRGTVEVDRKHGEQLRAVSLVELAPETLAGLEKYLASGFIKGVGPMTAQKIVATFGLDALHVLDEEPHRLREVEGLGERRRVALARAWKDQRALRDITIFLQASCAGTGRTRCASCRVTRIASRSTSTASGSRRPTALRGPSASCPTRRRACKRGCSRPSTT